MTNPAIQNDFSYYRRTLSRMRINNVPVRTLCSLSWTLTKSQSEKLHFQQLQSLSFYFDWLCAASSVIGPIQQRHRSSAVRPEHFQFFFPSQSNLLKKNQRNKITQRKRQSGERENRYRWSSSSTDERRLWAADSLRPLAQSHISLTLSHDSLFP